MPVNLLEHSQKKITYAIDAWSANQQKKSGVETYAYQLIQAMKKCALEDNERVVLYSPVALEGDLAVLPNGWESKTLAWPVKKKWFPVGWMQVRMSFELMMHRPDVLFVPAQGLPRRFPFFNYKIITTVHDIGFKRFSNLYDASSRRRLSKLTKRSIRNVDHLLTVSEFSKQEIENIYRVASDRITVTPLAVDVNVYRPLPTDVVDSVLVQHRLGRNFFLYVGRLDKKKNVDTVIRAFEQFKSGRGVGDPFSLVLVGEPGFGFREMKNRIDVSPVKEDIQTLGYLEDADVAALMNAATAFLFPSWYEGFGIPNLEALSCGTPVIASDIPAHHEVVGDAALFVLPENADEWAHAMKRLVEDPSLKESLIQKGFLRASMFDWKKTAEKTWEVLRRLT